MTTVFFQHERKCHQSWKYGHAAVLWSKVRSAVSPQKHIDGFYGSQRQRETLPDLWSGKESGILVCDWLCRWLAFFVFPWESGTLIPLRSHCVHCSHHNWTKRNSYKAVESNMLILYRFFLLIKVVRLLVIIQGHLRILQRLISHLKWREQQ